MRSTLLCLGLLAGLAAVAPSPVHAAAAGCCQYKDSCEATDDADACKAADGHHYQLGFCDGKTCHPTAPSPIEPRPTGLWEAVCPALPASVQAFQTFVPGFAEPTPISGPKQ